MTPLGASLLVACGGALGALGRYWTGLLVLTFWTHSIPLATLLVNVVGSLLIGLLATAGWGGAPMRAFAIVGLLGGFTTFSAYSLETVRLLEMGRMAQALLYCGGSVLLCLLAAAVGVALGRALA